MELQLINYLCAVTSPLPGASSACKWRCQSLSLSGTEHARSLSPQANHSTGERFLLLGFSDWPSLQPALFALVLLGYLLTLAGNAALLLLAVRDPRLHSPMYYFLRHLAVLDAGFSTSVAPFLLAGLRGPALRLPRGGCLEGGRQGRRDRQGSGRLAWRRHSLHQALLRALTGPTHSGRPQTGRRGPCAVILASYGAVGRALCALRSRGGRRKALGTCGSHLSAVCLFYGSASYTYLQPTRSYNQGRGKFVSLFYTVLTPALNPLIYTLRNKEVQGAARRLRESLARRQDRKC
ncbi:PREDICTED: putative olfactory receptor 2I1 [Chinchilla lanigera]|uniref:putative olfactory receptor 2I1 n=1 Tax=Chinchilla lanigera TaxID=34839 RepID=UPI00038EC3A5|nr:PREDICTED: putative olfactory receptor 2I1 [Chinchilla lanigera]